MEVKTRAWTLGYPPAYERATRIPGNAKAPGGYAFKTQSDAEKHARTHEDASRYAPYEIELPGTWGKCTTRSFAVAAQARHDWHSDVRPTMPQCGVCNGLEASIDHALLIVAAPFINPDTGLPA